MRSSLEKLLGSLIYGDPDTVRDGLTKLLRRTDPDELMLFTSVGDPAARLLIARSRAAAGRLYTPPHLAHRAGCGSAVWFPVVHK
jgi:alkanesulfonate monooxygenase SsuD/methylene tetrahydromethanopterin reductase-like flavin-dependent oxidoreductase (luciferase family)